MRDHRAQIQTAPFVQHVGNLIVEAANLVPDSGHHCTGHNARSTGMNWRHGYVRSADPGSAVIGRGVPRRTVPRKQHHTRQVILAESVWHWNSIKRITGSISPRNKSHTVLPGIAQIFLVAGPSHLVLSLHATVYSFLDHCTLCFHIAWCACDIALCASRSKRVRISYFCMSFSVQWKLQHTQVMLVCIFADSSGWLMPR